MFYVAFKRMVIREWLKWFGGSGDGRLVAYHVWDRCPLYLWTVKYDQIDGNQEPNNACYPYRPCPAAFPIAHLVEEAALWEERHIRQAAVR